MKTHTMLIGVALLGLIGCSEAPMGDPVRGEKIHEACLDCHGIGLYVSPDRKVKSLDHLRKETLRWGDYYNPAFSPQDVDDMVAYLNRDFYKFK